MAGERVAVVTGGNKGIGREICRQLSARGVRTILTARDEGRGRAAREALEKSGARALFHQLDVTASPLKSVQLGDGLAGVGASTIDLLNSMIYVGSAEGVIYGVQFPLP